MDTPPTTTTATSTSVHTEVTGRVVRLHFQCVAELPMGSFLRVTSSTLWAPGSAATDPTEATPALLSAASAGEGFTTSNTTTSTTGRSSSSKTTTSSSSKHAPPPPVDDSTANSSTTVGGGLYTSSVEMVTSPDKYPLWWTRRPVVVVLHNPRKTVQHHYYRYLVVSPGATSTNGIANSTTSLQDTTTNTSASPVSTSNEMAGSTTVWQWEDPFGMLLTNRNSNMPQESSMASLASSIVIQPTNTSNEYRNLPYRTVDIPVSGSSGSTSSSTPSTVTIAQDRWGNTDDATFRAYRIREAVRCVCLFVKCVCICLYCIVIATCLYCVRYSHFLDVCLFFYFFNLFIYLLHSSKTICGANKPCRNRACQIFPIGPRTQRTMSSWP